MCNEVESMREIKFSWLVKLQYATIRHFEALDEDYPDGRVVAIYERTIQYWLNKMTADKKEQDKILEMVDQNNWNTLDNSYKCMCDKLREMGFTILEGV